MHRKHLPPRLLNHLLGALLPAAGSSRPPPQQPLGIFFRGNPRLGVPADFFGGGQLPDAGVEVAEDGLGTCVYGVAGRGGEVGGFLGGVVGEMEGGGEGRGASGCGGGGEVGLAD